MVRGSCLCGAVHYEVAGELRQSVACHCSQCRKTSGHFWSATQVAGDRLTIHEDGALRWFQSSAKARRGFCRLCGSSLFWQHADDGGAVSIGSGTLEALTGMIEARHIHIENKGDYYEIPERFRQEGKDE